jgi:hypothetical protein
MESRKSTTGMVFILNNAAISWSSKLQTTVSCSTAEAEYVAAAAAVREGLWLRKLLVDMGMGNLPVRIFGDNEGALQLLKHPIASARSKHIDVAHHFARERVMRGEVSFEHISTERMVADIMTKALPRNKTEFCREGMGLSPT